MIVTSTGARVELQSLRPAEQYRALLAAGGVYYQSCARLPAPVFPPRVLCPACGSPALSWQESAGRGTVYSATTVYSRSAPYTVALVDLDEGFRAMATLVDAEEHPSPIGSRVDVAAGELEGQLALLASAAGDADLG